MGTHGRSGFDRLVLGSTHRPGHSQGGMPGIGSIECLLKTPLAR